MLCPSLCGRSNLTELGLRPCLFLLEPELTSALGLSPFDPSFVASAATTAVVTPQLLGGSLPGKPVGRRLQREFVDLSSSSWSLPSTSPRQTTMGRPNGLKVSQIRSSWAPLRRASIGNTGRCFGSCRGALEPSASASPSGGPSTANVSRCANSSHKHDGGLRM